MINFSRRVWLNMFWTHRSDLRKLCVLLKSSQLSVKGTWKHKILKTYLLIQLKIFQSFEGMRDMKRCCWHCLATLTWGTLDIAFTENVFKYNTLRGQGKNLPCLKFFFQFSFPTYSTEYTSLQWAHIKVAQRVYYDRATVISLSNVQQHWNERVNEALLGSAQNLYHTLAPYHNSEDPNNGNIWIPDFYLTGNQTV